MRSSFNGKHYIYSYEYTFSFQNGFWMASFHLALSSHIVIKSLFKKYLSKPISSWGCEKQPVQKYWMPLFKRNAPAFLSSGSQDKQCPHHEVQHLRHFMWLLTWNCFFSNNREMRNEWVSWRTPASVCLCAQRHEVPLIWNLHGQFLNPRKYWASSGNPFWGGTDDFQSGLTGCTRLWGNDCLFI